MHEYTAPVRDMRFVFDHIVDLKEISEFEAYSHLDEALVEQVLTQAGRLANEVLSPLNQRGDHIGSALEGEDVTTPEGFKEAYQAFVEGGWNGVAFDPEHGGGGLPWTMVMALQEMWNGSNMSFALCPILTQGAIKLLGAHASPEQKSMYLEKMISGEWTGTMNLTEPTAGSDVGALRTKAELQADGSYRISGQKIFITYGEHDFAENIIHLVLARTPDAPPGTKGISCFIVPKYLVNEDGSLGKRNDLRCVNLEKKLGIHASPTCVMSYGDNGECVGYLIGEENRGMRYMFTMMNDARLTMAAQGVGVASRAYQRALAFSMERKQGRLPTTPPNQQESIIVHADVRRMLMTMKSELEAMRALTYLNAAAMDKAGAHPDETVRAGSQALVDLLIPMAKAWCTDLGVEISSLGVQIHGGMGFIEETGAAQHMRDARISPIYEGTNGIHAMDLLTRKLPMQGGEVVRSLLNQMRELLNELNASGNEDLAIIAGSLGTAVDAVSDTSEWLLEKLQAADQTAAAGCAPYLRMFSITIGGYLLAKGAFAATNLLADNDPETDYLNAKVQTARFYAEHVLSQAVALKTTATAGQASMFAVSPEFL